MIQEVPAAARTSVALMARCGEKNSERDTHRMTRKCRLALPVCISEAIVAGIMVPVMLLSSWLEFLLGYNLWHTLSGLHAANDARCAAQWSSFWAAYKQVCPSHPIFARAAKGEVDLSRCAALLIHGDEGRTKKKSAVFILSAHSVLGFGSHISNPGPETYCKQKLNWLGHTMSTRWLLGVLPKTYYEDGDEFFQKYLEVFVTDINKIWESGVVGANGVRHHFVIINIMGDWPFLAKAFSLSRCFANVSKQATSKQAPNGICHCCLADRNGFPWEDFEAEQPRWRETINQVNPFVGSPSFMNLPHDPTNPPSFIGQDCFHAWHLGAAKQFLGSCLVLLSETFFGTSIPKRFQKMSDDLFQWARLHKERPLIRRLTRDTIGWPSVADYPCATWSKGSTSTCILRWFISACQRRSHLIEEGSLLQLAFQAAREIYSFFSKSFREDVWMDRLKALELSYHGFAFLRLHGRCAQRAHASGRALFLFMPNLHRLHELFFCLYDQAQIADKCLNSMIWNCQIEEDYIGRPSRTSRRVGVQQVIRRTMERCLQSAYAKFIDAGFLILSTRSPA